MLKKCWSWLVENISLVIVEIAVMCWLLEGLGIGYFKPTNTILFIVITVTFETVWQIKKKQDLIIKKLEEI